MVSSTVIGRTTSSFLFRGVGGATAAQAGFEGNFLRLSWLETSLFLREGWIFHPLAGPKVAPLSGMEKGLNLYLYFPLGILKRLS